MTTNGTHKPETPLHIVRLDVENLMRVEAVSITPAGEVVEIAGRNGQGKSSVLNSVAMALGGAKLCPSQPVRKGAKTASVTVDLGEYIVTRSWSSPEDRTGTLKVEGKDGRRIAKPQDLLNSLIGPISFDPHLFLRMEPKKQADELKRLAGLDFSDLDADRRALYDERTAVNRDIDRLKARLAAMPAIPDGPDQEVSVAELSAELQAAMEKRRAADDERRALEQCSQRIGRCDSTIARLEQELANAKKELAEHQAVHKELTRAVEQAEAAVPDVDAIQKRLAGAEAVNRDVRLRRDRRQLVAEMADADAASQTKTAAIEQIDQFKQQAIEDAQFPVEGLGFDEEGVTLNGVPLAQASMAEQLRCAVAVGLAQNPRIRVILLRDGAVLDDDSMRVLADLAREHEAQVFVERIHGGKGAVVIEDGHVAAATAAAS